MWTCKVCRVNFAAESVESHLCHNHITGDLSIGYRCGQCRFMTQVFDEMAQHCLTTAHSPGRMRIIGDVTGYYAQLSIALEKITATAAASPLLEQDTSSSIIDNNPSFINNNINRRREGTFDSQRQGGDCSLSFLNDKDNNFTTSIAAGGQNDSIPITTSSMRQDPTKIAWFHQSDVGVNNSRNRSPTIDPFPVQQEEEKDNDYQQEQRLPLGHHPSFVSSPEQRFSTTTQEQNSKVVKRFLKTEIGFQSDNEEEEETAHESSDNHIRHNQTATTRKQRAISSPAGAKKLRSNSQQFSSSGHSYEDQQSTTFQLSPSPANTPSKSLTTQQVSLATSAVQNSSNRYDNYNIHQHLEQKDFDSADPPATAVKVLIPEDIRKAPKRTNVGRKQILNRPNIVHGADASKVVRGGAGRFLCSFCPKVFLSLGLAQNHQRIHTGERPFTCRWCPKAFIQPAHLKTHESAVHESVTVETCGECGKRFRHTQSFRRHRTKCGGNHLRAGEGRKEETDRHRSESGTSPNNDASTIIELSHHNQHNVDTDNNDYTI